jgi:AcrR family transcriptional regulator
MPAEHAASANGPRRTALTQARSKQTRRRLVRAALALWTERGFDHGVEDTTVDEIVRAAGVTKGTFYFHFAHKEDILLELGWGTAQALYDEAVRATGTRRSGLVLVRQLLVSLAARAEAVPRAAVLQSMTRFYARGIRPSASGRRGIHDALAVALEAARAQGELTPGTDVDEMSRVLDALAMDALLRWAQGDRRRLRGVLQTRADLILAGAR